MFWLARALSTSRQVCLPIFARIRVSTDAGSCRRGCALHLRAMPARLPPRFIGSAFPGVLEGAGDADAWRATGRELGVEARGLEVVAGVGGEASVAPGGLDVVEPGVQRDQLLVANVVDAAARVVGVWVAFHETGRAEERQVLADERLACAKRAGERGRSAGRLCEFPHDLLAHRLGERGESVHLLGWCSAVAAMFLRVVSVMHPLVLVLPGSRVFMRVARVRGARRAVLLCLRGALCGLSLVERGPQGRSAQEVDVACPVRSPGSTFLCCQHQTGGSAGWIAGAPETDCPQEGWI